MAKFIPDRLVFYRYDGELGHAMSVQEGPSDTYKVLENRPIRNAKVERVSRWDGFEISFEIDGQRSRTILSFEEFLDIIQHPGIRKGGLITAPLIWVGSGTYPLLTRVGSETYKRYERKDKLSKERPIKKTDLVVGNVYSTHAGLKGVYLSRVNTIELIERGSSGILDCKKRRNQMLWLELTSWGQGNVHHLEEALSNPGMLLKWDACGAPKVKASHSFKVKQREQLKVPPDIITLLRGTYLRALRREAARNMMFVSDIIDDSRLLNLVPVNEEPEISPGLLEMIEVYNAKESRRLIIIDLTTQEELPELLASGDQIVREAALERAKELGIAEEVMGAENLGTHQ